MRFPGSFALLALLQTNSFALDLKDATGALVHLSDHPTRIVALAPSVAELASEFLELDLQRIVGVAESTDFPPALQSVESIGPYHRFNLEKVAALKPDLVLATLEGNARDQVLHLREMGIPVFVLSTGSLSEVASAMSQTALILGEAARGEKVSDTFRKRLEEIRARGLVHASKTPLRVMLQLDDSPLIVAGGKSFLSEALVTVGAKNIFGDLDAGYPTPSAEDVLRRDPDVVLVIAFGDDVDRFRRMGARWTQYPRLAAARKKQIKVIFADTLLRPSMRLLEGLTLLEKMLYGKN
jgi:iron complex transport system substrate-binding protein